MAMSLHDVLERRFGVDEDDFVAALLDFADRAGPPPVAELDPTEYLGGRQQAALRRLGASLAPIDARELGPVAGLAAAFAELVARSLTVAQVAERLAVDTSRIRQRIHARSIYAFKHRGGWLIPAFQVQRNALLPGLDSVVAALPLALHPVAVSGWFTTPASDLMVDDVAMSPVDWLAAGGSPQVAAQLASVLDETS